MNPMSKVVALALALALSLPALAVCAQEIPTKITADSLTYASKGASVVFTGNVRVKRPDIEILADKLTAYLEQAGEGGGKNPLAEKGGEIKRIEAVGGVRILQQGRTATSDRAVFDMAAQVLTLTGDPVVSEGKNYIKGETIRLFLEDNRSEVVGGKQKVEAVFFTDDEGLAGKEKK